MEIPVIPAVIPESAQSLAVDLARLRGSSSVVHIDICDGRLTPAPSWPFSGDRGEWRGIVAQEDGLPMWESFEFEFDLMVSNPLVFAREAIEAGAARVVLHLGAPGAAEAFEALLEDGRAGIWLAGGVGLDLGAHLESIGRAAGYQQMGIERIGSQGQPFDPSSLGGVRAVRAAHPDLPIAFDGGVSAENAAEIVAAGATRLVVGSAVIRAENPRAAAREIARAARGD